MRVCVRYYVCVLARKLVRYCDGHHIVTHFMGTMFEILVNGSSHRVTAHWNLAVLSWGAGVLGTG